MPLNFLTPVAWTRLTRLGLVAGMSSALACASAAQAAETGSTDTVPAPTLPQAAAIHTKLANGLEVVLVPNRLAPVVTTVVTYKVGADETPKDFPGTAHAQEHMLFRGAADLSSDALAYLMTSMGGRFNAMTRQSVTQYSFTVPAEDLDVALHIEASRMHLILDREADWSKEKKAIEQEVAQDLSSPTYVLYMKLRAALFAGTPYARDALGTIPSFEATRARRLKAFYDAWYAPNNAVLVVAGDFDAPKALTEITTLFGPIAPKKLPPRPQIELKPLAPAHLDLKTDYPYGLAVLALRLPGFDSPDRPAMEILADVLNSPRGDLYGLVPSGKALYAGFEFEALPKAGLGYAMVAYPDGADPRSLEREVRAILADVAANGVPADLVEAAKRQERRALEFQKNSIDDLATAWAESVAVNRLSSPDEELAQLEGVTVADVDRVAHSYLDLDHAVSAVLTPQHSGKPIASKGFGGGEQIALGEAIPASLPAWAERAVARTGVPESSVHPVTSTLANGLTLIVLPEDISATVSVYGHIRNRAELEVPAGKEGLSQVLDQMLSYGTETLDRIQYQKALDDVGVDASAGVDFSLQVLSDQVERGLALLADVELHPRLPAEALPIVKQQTADTIAGQLKSPSYLSSRALLNAIFPPGDPTLRQALPSTVAGITLDDVRTYHRAVFRPDLTTIVVIGKIAPARAKELIEKYFGAWQAQGPKPETVLPPVPPSGPSVTDVPDASRVQDRVTLAETIGITRHDEDYYALELGNHVLGGGFYSTRLYRDLRKNTGLVYYVGTQIQAGKSRAIYFVEYACDPKNVARVSEAIKREIASLQSKPVTESELLQAKAQLLREIPLDESDVDEIGRGLLHRAELDLPLDEPTRAAQHYLALDAASIQAAFAKWLRPDSLALISQGPKSR
jgi:zinc protease